MQLYTPASDKIRSLSTRMELMETVPLIDSVMLSVRESRGMPSLYQEMSGRGIPEAEQVKETVSEMSATVSMGNSKREVFAVKLCTRDVGS